MERIAGKSVSGGIAIGRICVFEKEEAKVRRSRIEDSEAEIKRYEDSKCEAIDELSALYETACAEVGETNAKIFEVHQMMMEDEDYNDSVKNLISSEMVNAEYAVAKTGEIFADLFSSMDDEYLKARAADVKDISERIISRLNGGSNGIGLGEEPVILMAKELSPSETVQMDKERLLGFVTEIGSSNSHTAILARTMNIPAVLGVPLDTACNGKMAILDGKQGVLIIEPEEAVLKEYEDKQKELQEQETLLQNLKGKENITKSGKTLKLYANIGNEKDIMHVLQNDAGGIGLFRSEFLYLEREDYPTEEEQFQVYKNVLSAMAGKPVIIRTLDIGADKQVDYFNLEKEENPAMGYRAIRICLDRIEIFKTQLRALYRASAYGNLSIMYPMIISLDEVQKIKQISEEVRNELNEAGIPMGDVKQGIMIETPAAAIMSDVLAKEVDFFSIGTNDLTQYTLAVDRQNSMLESINDTHHEAVLRLIQMTVENGHKAGIWVGICGELGADTTLTKRFVSMGVDELSVAPGAVLKVRNAIRECE